MLSPEAVEHFCDVIGGCVCHRLPAHSLVVAHRQLCVCARCTGLYLGFEAGLLYLLAARRLKADSFGPLGRLLAILLLIVPMGIDGLTATFGGRESTNLLRFSTGGLAGAGFAFLLLPLVNFNPYRGPQKALFNRPSEAWLAGIFALVLAFIALVAGQRSVLLLDLALCGGVIFLYTLLALMVLALLRHHQAPAELLAKAPLRTAFQAMLVAAGGLAGLYWLSNYLLQQG